jgi:hypothetical protein
MIFLGEVKWELKICPMVTKQLHNFLSKPSLHSNSPSASGPQAPSPLSRVPNHSRLPSRVPAPRGHVLTTRCGSVHAFTAPPPVLQSSEFCLPLSRVSCSGVLVVKSRVHSTRPTIQTLEVTQVSSSLFALLVF